MSPAFAGVWMSVVGVGVVCFPLKGVTARRTALVSVSREPGRGCAFCLFTDCTHKGRLDCARKGGRKPAGRGGHCVRCGSCQDPDC